MTSRIRSSKNGWALLAALGIDNFGSGLFLPLVVVYITTTTNISLASAGIILTGGTVVGLLAPPLAGRLVDRIGPKTIVVCSQLIQMAGMSCYLVATNSGWVFAGAALVAAGAQSFYSAVFVLIADLASAGPKDHAYANVEMVRSATFGLGALAAAALLSTTDIQLLKIAVVVNLASFAVAAVILSLLVSRRSNEGPVGISGAESSEANEPDHLTNPSAPEFLGNVAEDRSCPLSSRSTRELPASPFKNLPYLGVIMVTTLLGLSADFLLVGLAVYVSEVEPAATWAAAGSVAFLTASIALLNGPVVRKTIEWSRPRAMATGGYCFALWAVLVMMSPLLPVAWIGTWVLATTVLLIAGCLLFGSRVNALAEAAAPPSSRGRYMAAFQYSFTVAGLLAPLLVSSMSFGLWIPWMVVAVAALLGAVSIPLIARYLPQAALTSGS